MSYFCKCPRCGHQAYEQLHTFSHCVECLYFEDRHLDIEKTYFDALKVEKSALQEEVNTSDDEQTDELLVA